jgi:hypothetical protein
MVSAWLMLGDLTDLGVDLEHAGQPTPSQLGTHTVVTLHQRERGGQVDA